MWRQAMAQSWEPKNEGMLIIRANESFLVRQQRHQRQEQHQLSATNDTISSGHRLNGSSAAPCISCGPRARRCRWHGGHLCRLSALSTLRRCTRPSGSGSSNKLWLGDSGCSRDSPCVQRRLLMMDRCCSPPGFSGRHPLRPSRTRH